MIQNALIKKIIKGNVAILKSERRATLQFMINFLPVLALIRTVWILHYSTFLILQLSEL